MILFEKMGMPNGKKTKSGYSTAADILEKLAPEYPVVQKNTGLPSDDKVENPPMQTGWLATFRRMAESTARLTRQLRQPAESAVPSRISRIFQSAWSLAKRFVRSLFRGTAMSF